MVEIPDNRIQKLRAKGRLTERLYKEANYDALWDETIEKIAKEFAKKLAEYHKIEFGEDEHGLWFDASLEIIVPVTPESNEQIAAEAKSERAKQAEHEWPEIVKKHKEKLKSAKRSSAAPEE
ncbi:hypothetical protein AB8Z38_28955 [Bradyrhizobium sp. LLZ17]|uniref:Uncharacterized protein n=1 Tax=Bradyrhizobium sp. LLZ17 TaxID=3239388 RepID=A0AB39XIS1_9BRAD